MNKREVGSYYENTAANYLIKQGYFILNKNFRCRIGEIDLIAKEDNYLCFIEVKYRKSTFSGHPSEAITPAKIRKIRKSADYYILINNIPQSFPCRFDVVVILENEITLLKNAF